MKSSSNIIKASRNNHLVSSWSPLDFPDDNFQAEPEVRKSSEIQKIDFPEVAKETIPNRIRQYAFAPLQKNTTDTEVLEDSSPTDVKVKRSHGGMPARHLDFQIWVADDLEVKKNGIQSVTEGDVEISIEEITRLKKRADETLANAQLEAEDLAQRAREKHENALVEAERIVQEAQAQRDRIYEIANAEGVEAAKTEALQTLKSIEAIFNEAKTWRDDVLGKSESLIIEMIQSIAKKLFGIGYRLDPTAIDEMVGRAITEASRLGNLRVYLNPDDQGRLLSLWQESELVVNGQKIQLIANQEILPGGCFVEGEFGSVDSRIETQLSTIQNTIASTLKIKGELAEE